MTKSCTHFLLYTVYKKKKFSTIKYTSTVLCNIAPLPPSAAIRRFTAVNFLVQCSKIIANFRLGKNPATDFMFLVSFLSRVFFYCCQKWLRIYRNFCTNICVFSFLCLILWTWTARKMIVFSFVCRRYYFFRFFYFFFLHFSSFQR